MSTEEVPEKIDPTVIAPMGDREPQTAEGRVLWHFTMLLDGFVAGPNARWTDDWDLVPPRPCPGVRRDDRRRARRSGWL